MNLYFMKRFTMSVHMRNPLKFKTMNQSNDTTKVNVQRNLLKELNKRLVQHFLKHSLIQHSSLHSY